jgi:hypothetical protein
MAEEKIPGCDDCPCPEWLDNIFTYYAEQTPVTYIPMLYYAEKDDIPYYAINNVYSSCVACALRFFDADGTEIGEEHKDYETVINLFSEGKFRHNEPCKMKYWEKYNLS